MKPSRNLVAMAVLAASLLIGAGCGSDDNSEAPSSGGVKTLTMGTAPWIGYGPWYIADEKGFDVDNGVDIKLKSFRDDAGLTTAYAAGKIDSLNAALYNFFTYLTENVPLKMVLVEDVSLTADAVIAGPGVDSIQDLRGKKVAAEELAYGNVMLDYTLKQAGLTRDDIQFVNIPAADAATALISGRVAAAATYEPYITEALKDKRLKVIYDAAKRPGLISDQLAVNPDYADANKETVVGALRAWDDAIKFYRTNTKEAQAIIAKNVGSKPEDLTTAFEGVKYYDLKQSQKLLKEDFPSLTTDLISLLQECCKYPSDAPDVESVIDPAPAADALKK